MRYDPNQAKQPSVGPAPGTYYFRVTKAEESVSDARNDMLRLSLAVHISDERQVNVFDYLVNTPGGLWKAKMFCAEVGIDFDLGELNEDTCLNKSGWAVFDYDKKDLAKVKSGQLKRAYLKVVRYGDKAAADAARAEHAKEEAQLDQPAQPHPSDAPPADDNEIPF